MARSERELKKMTVRYYADDLEYLRSAYPHRGYNEILRALASRHVRKLRNLEAEHLGGLPGDLLLAEKLSI